MKKGFSLLELIFAIVIIGVIASFAVPKFLDTKDSAVVSTLKRDISSIISSIQTYHLQVGKIDNISDAITLNSQNWTTDETNSKKISDFKSCVTIEVKSDEISLTLDESNTDNVCAKLKEDEGIETQSYQLL